ncbi:MAG TPA: sigma-70 family RNA polymerase sigma factor [Phycisphaerae bacterium]|nr:sigma-70 family RNA polymerase sigma factor [Phycisphaerae bacterium]
MPAKAEKSFEELAVPHLELVYRVARRLCRNEHEAEDLVQETYLKAYKAFSRFEMREFGIKPWLLKILHNTFLNRLARERRAPRLADHKNMEQMHEAPGAGSEISEPPALDYEKLDSEVKRAIDQLQPEFRTVLLLWGTMEVSYQEIANTLGVPIGTVMSRLHRARQALTRTLHDYAREHRLIPAGEQ